MDRYGFLDAVREAWERDPRGFLVGLLLVPPACYLGYLWLCWVLVAGQA